MRNVPPENGVRMRAKFGWRIEVFVVLPWWWSTIVKNNNKGIGKRRECGKKIKRIINYYRSGCCNTTTRAKRRVSRAAKEEVGWEEGFNSAPAVTYCTVSEVLPTVVINSESIIKISECGIRLVKYRNDRRHELEPGDELWNFRWLRIIVYLWEYVSGKGVWKCA